MGSWEEGRSFRSPCGLTSPAVVWESMATGQAPAPGQCTVHSSSCRRLSAEISARDGTSSRPRVRAKALRMKRAYSASSESGSACSVLGWGERTQGSVLRRLSFSPPSCFLTLQFMLSCQFPPPPTLSSLKAAHLALLNLPPIVCMELNYFLSPLEAFN